MSSIVNITLIENGSAISVYNIAVLESEKDMVMELLEWLRSNSFGEIMFVRHKDSIIVETTSKNKFNL